MFIKTHSQEDVSRPESVDVADPDSERELLQMANGCGIAIDHDLMERDGSICNRSDTTRPLFKQLSYVSKNHIIFQSALLRRRKRKHTLT